MSMRADLSEDLRRCLYQSPAHRARGDSLKARLSAVLSPPFQCVLIFRISHWLWRRRWYWAAGVMAGLNRLIFKASLEPASRIGPGVFLPHPPGTVFCGSAGRGLTVYSIVTCGPCADGPWRVEQGPVLGDNITIGAHSVIQGPVRVGDGTRIGFAVVLNRDAPSGALVISRAMRAAIQPAKS